MSELLYAGKVKQVWSTEDPDIIEFRYTDQISVFDQIIPSLIPRKGESLNRSSVHWLKAVEEAGICSTHLIEMNAPDRVRARRYDVVRGTGAIAKDGDVLYLWNSSAGITLLGRMASLCPWRCFGGGVRIRGRNRTRGGCETPSATGGIDEVRSLRWVVDHGGSS